MNPHVYTHLLSLTRYVNVSSCIWATCFTAYIDNFIMQGWLNYENTFVAHRSGEEVTEKRVTET